MIVLLRCGNMVIIAVIVKLGVITWVLGAERIVKEVVLFLWLGNHITGVVSVVLLVLILSTFIRHELVGVAKLVIVVLLCRI